MTRVALTAIVRAVVAEAFAADPVFMDECVRAIFGGPVFVWDLASMAQIHALHRSALLVRLAADTHQ